MRTILGGKIQDPNKKDTGYVLPGPGAYSAEDTDHVPSYKIMQPTEPKKKRKIA